MSNKLLIISLNSDPILQYGTQHNGGQSKYILELGKNLVMENWDIDIFTIRNTGSEKLVQITEGFFVHRFDLQDNREYSYEVNENDINHLTNSIIRFIDENKLQYNIVLCCYWLSAIIGLKLKEILKKNTLVTFCSLGYFKQMMSENPNSLNYRIDKEKYIAQNIDHIIATSDEEKKVLIEFYEVPSNKISVIPRGVDTKKFRKINEL